MLLKLHMIFVCWHSRVVFICVDLRPGGCCWAQLISRRGREQRARKSVWKTCAQCLAVEARRDTAYVSIFWWRFLKSASCSDNLSTFVGYIVMWTFLLHTPYWVYPTLCLWTDSVAMGLGKHLHPSLDVLKCCRIHRRSCIFLTCLNLTCDCLAAGITGTKTLFKGFSNACSWNTVSGGFHGFPCKPSVECVYWQCACNSSFYTKHGHSFCCLCLLAAHSVAKNCHSLHYSLVCQWSCVIVSQVRTFQKEVPLAPEWHSTTVAVANVTMPVTRIASPNVACIRGQCKF